MELIYLDACVVIYAIENHVVHAPQVIAAMSDHEAGAFAVSPLVRLECLVKPLRDGDLRLQQRYETGLSQFRHLSMPSSVYADAAKLRARFGLNTRDALHLACAHHHRCTQLWTNDDRLAHASHGLAVNLLRSVPS